MIPSAVRQQVLERDGYRCVSCGDSVFARRYSLQHRRARGSGGTRRPDTPQNLLTMCGTGTTGCHGAVEANPTQATREGYRVSQYADPLDVPVYVHRTGWVFLTPAGGYDMAPPQAIPS